MTLLAVVAALIIIAVADGLPRWLELRRSRSQRPQVDPSHDPLTLLPSRTWLLTRLDQALSRARRNGRFVAVLALDIDRFGSVNNRMGHEWGDAVLRRVALRLQDVARDEDTVIRLDGDQFAVLLEDLADAHSPARVAQRILDNFRRPVDVGGNEVLVSFGIGIAVHFSGDISGRELLRDASLAMARAKRKGSGRFEVFDPDLAKHAIRRLGLEAELRDAPYRGETVVHYQPEILLDSGRMIGMEALVRWRHPTHGLLSPDHFIPVAEETGLIVPLGRWVLKEACRTASDLQRRGLTPHGFRLSVNVSVRQLQADANFIDYVADVLADLGLASRHLVIEVTETAEEMEPVAPALEQLRIMGVGVAVDDFGTGYSSLSRLKSLPVNIVKIDQRFVRGIRDPADLAIVRSIVDLAEVLGLDVIAEGIETRSQLEALRSARCTRGQGFYFSKGVPEDCLESILSVGVLPLSRQTHAWPA